MERETGEAKGLDALRGNHLLLTTFRKSGEAVPTPVWYSRRGEQLYVFSNEKAGKVKRIRASERVQIAPCTGTGRVIGPTLEARAHILPREEQRVARRALRRKYWQVFPLFELVSNGLLRRTWAFLEITLLPAVPPVPTASSRRSVRQKTRRRQKQP